MKKIAIIVILIILNVVSPLFASSYEDYIKERFELYYETLTDNDFEYAYTFRTSDWTSEHSLQWFSDNWSNNKSIELVDFEIIDVNYNYSPEGEITGGEAIVKIRTYSEDYMSNKILHKAYYSGKAYCTLTVRGGYGWFIGDIDVSEE